MTHRFSRPATSGQTHLAAGLAWRFDGRNGRRRRRPSRRRCLSILVATASTALPAGFNGTVMVSRPAPLTVTLPPSPTAGQQVTVKDATGAAGTHPITVAGTIEGAADMTIDFAYGWVALTSIAAASGCKRDV